MNDYASHKGQFWRADPPVHSAHTSPSPPAKPETGDRGGLTAEQVIEQVQSAAQILKHRLEEHFQEFGLNEIRYTVLRIVHHSSPHGCSQTDLAETVQQSESSISTLVERMRADNLVYRLRSKLDRRKRVLILTERGQAILHHIEHCHSERLEQMLQQFDQAQRAELHRLLQQLIDYLTPALPEAPSANSAPIAPPHLDRSAAPMRRAESLPGEAD